MGCALLQGIVSPLFGAKNVQYSTLVAELSIRLNDSHAQPASRWKGTHAKVDAQLRKSKGLYKKSELHCQGNWQCSSC